MSEQSYRVFEGEPHYIEGYVPSSFDSQHSSLLRSSTWLGMGLVLSSLSGLGMFVFGLGSAMRHSQDQAGLFMVIGVIVALICVIGGFGLIHYGRRHYRAYVAATGRKH